MIASRLEEWIQKELRSEAVSQIMYSILLVGFGVPCLFFTVLGLTHLIGPEEWENGWSFVLSALGYFFIYLYMVKDTKLKELWTGRKKVYLEYTHSILPPQIFDSSMFVFLSVTFFGPMLLLEAFISACMVIRFWEADCSEEALVLRYLHEQEGAVERLELEQLFRLANFERSMRTLSRIHGIMELEIHDRQMIVLSSDLRERIEKG